MGYYVYMDENGDAEGNYSLVSLCEVNAWRKANGRQYSSDDNFEGNVRVQIRHTHDILLYKL